MLLQLPFLCRKERVKIQNRIFKRAHREQLNQQAKEYYQNQREKHNQYGKVYYQQHKEEIKQRTRQYQLTHSEQQKQRHRAYYKKYKEETKYRVKEYYQQNRESLNQRNKHYRQNHPDLCRKYHRKTKSKRRRLGSIPLWNKPFDSSHEHHIDRTHVIYIPEAIHNSIHHNVWTGCNMDVINAKAFQWLEQQTNTTPLQRF